MRIVSGGRQLGKTTAMIHMAAETNAYIVCPNRQQVDHVFRMSKDMGVRIHQPITWDDLIEKRYHARGISAFVIDNLDQCIQQVTPVPVLGASVPAADVLIEGDI